MKIIHSIKELRALRQTLSSVALVPTMGNLHDGHLSLVERAKAAADHVIVSIFVNPIQFGENEDFGSYPRTLEADCEKLAKAGVTAVFAPSAKEMYPSGVQSVRVVPSDIQNELCGATREGHFNGVTTVVTKLFNIVTPDCACFGEKDFQQLHIIKEMVNELNVPIEIISVPIKRDENGLALSSRNGYLSVEEKAQAIELSECLHTVRAAILESNEDLRAIEQKAMDHLNAKGWQVDYLSIRDADTLAVASARTGNLIVLAAAKIGATRLLDNLRI
ncbi:pantoate--beta-alanine ligase [Wohlfahrtiimonas chitiniclastica]|uniref:pantoate--beta-alanine ligase n=1 Tax=Wohlfahrtiimonas chitiniclastica TaxID=400946 RepID=UPI001BCFB2F7|nr:pantoate--beta-alanine ligase [Wohlfahrtiimonas chitiniclastica]MBS7820399.1 pantoate--beta-alanine ligase [Wohlfahrtiimonas chitiniclastica]